MLSLQVLVCFREPSFSFSEGMQDRRVKMFRHGPAVPLRIILYAESWSKAALYERGLLSTS
jgi:hypothetical protein